MSKWTFPATRTQRENQRKFHLSGFARSSGVGTIVSPLGGSETHRWTVQRGGIFRSARRMVGGIHGQGACGIGSSMASHLQQGMSSSSIGLPEKFAELNLRSACNHN